MKKEIEELRDLFADKEALQEKRKNLIKKAKEHRDSSEKDVTKTELRNIDADLKSIDEKITNIQNQNQGETRKMELENRNQNKFETMEYRTAFKDYIQRGVRSDVLEFRADANTNTTTASAVIPTTVMNEIIKKMEISGNVLPLVRKLYVKGGVQIPILSVIPTASWITESAPSDRKAITANTSVQFSYYGLEIKIAQTLLSEITSIEAFEREFTIIAATALTNAKEIAIFNGTGSGQPTGITVDTRIVAGQKIALTAAKVVLFNEWAKALGKLPVSYRSGAKLFMSAATWDTYIAGMVDTTGQPVARVNYGVSDSISRRFMGYDVVLVEEDRIASFDTATTGKVFAILCNMNQYGLNTNGEMRVVQYVDEDKNVKVTKALEFVDGKVLDNNAFILLTKAV